MVYENMPLYPGMRPPCDGSPCMRVRLFDDACGGCHRAPPMRECERVVIDNPCCPGEQAEVTLGVDDCGNLVICVHRVHCGQPPVHCERPSHCERPVRPVPRCRDEWERWDSPCRVPCKRPRPPVWDGCERVCGR